MSTRAQGHPQLSQCQSQSQSQRKSRHEKENEKSRQKDDRESFRDPELAALLKPTQIIHQHAKQSQTQTQRQHERQMGEVEVKEGQEREHRQETNSKGKHWLGEVTEAGTNRNEIDKKSTATERSKANHSQPSLLEATQNSSSSHRELEMYIHKEDQDAIEWRVRQESLLSTPSLSPRSVRANRGQLRPKSELLT
jgi:hypothetical protein